MSVIKTAFSYGGPELYELAVVGPNGRLTYDTPVTNDVIGYLSPEGVTKAMIEVQKLEPNI